MSEPGVGGDSASSRAHKPRHKSDSTVKHREGTAGFYFFFTIQLKKFKPFFFFGLGKGEAKQTSNPKKC